MNKIRKILLRLVKLDYHCGKCCECLEAELIIKDLIKKAKEEERMKERKDIYQFFYKRDYNEHCIKGVEFFRIYLNHIKKLKEDNH